MSAAVALVLGCAGSVEPTGSTGGKTATVVVTPSAPSMSIGSTFPLQAQALDASGSVVSDVTIHWSSSDTNVVTISSIGVVTAKAIGTAQIAASAEGKSAVATLTVVPVPVATVVVLPQNDTVIAGNTIALQAFMYDAHGATLTSRTATWSTSVTGTATVDAAGNVTGVAAGTVTVTATSEGKTGAATIVVKAAPPVVIPVASVSVLPKQGAVILGTTLALQAITYDANNSVLTSRPITWRTSSRAIATIDASGVVTGVSLGTVTITATSEGKIGSTTVVVNPVPAVPVASVSVQTPNATPIVGTTVTLQATTYDTHNAVLTGRTVTWTTNAPGVALVDASGTVTTLTPGTVTITGTSEGKTDAVTLVVKPVPVASVSIATGPGTVIVGNTLPLQATTSDANGGTLTGRTVTWSSSDQGTATVNTSGVVTGRAQGNVTITATSEGVRGSVTIVVQPVPVASVTVSPSSGTVIIGNTIALQATTLDAGGGTLAGRAITWSTSDAGIATVNASGTVTGVALGTATITATSEGKTRSATITVQPVPPVPVASVTVAPSNATIMVGNTVALQATTLDASNATLTGRGVTWTTSAPGTALVDASGTVTGVAPGTATITATSEGKTGSATIIVQPVPIASVSITSLTGTNSVIAGNTLPLQATTSDANGGTLTGRTVTWSSNDPAIATIDALGIVTGKVAGSVTITATSEGVHGSITVVVQPVPVASVTVAPSTSTVIVGNTVTLQATTLDASNGTLTGRTVTWSTNAPGTATVDASGTVTGVAPGTATITATSEGKTGSATITIQPVPPAPVASVTVSPPSGNVIVGNTIALQATTLDASNGTLTGRSVAWSSSDPAKATVDGSGIVTGVAPGTVTITATSEGKSGSATIVVDAAVDQVVPDDPNNTTITLAQQSTVDLTVQVLDAQGNQLAGRTVVWSSSDPAVATVATNGSTTNTATVTALSTTGTVTITATCDGKSTTFTISIP